MSKTILTVDDSVSIRQMVGFTLKSAGYNVIPAVDGEEGLELARSGKVDLVLTDQNMPRMDGLSLVRALRAMPSYARTPILLLTTESTDAMKAQGKAAGATGWLVKPFDPARLVEVVQRCVG
jgi:two-component system chemotaxis response regulator CheY